MEQSDYKQALDALSAVNVSGLVHSLDKIVTRLWLDPNATTSTVNEHPIVKMYVSQIVALTYGASVDFEVWVQAYRTCKLRAGLL